jgi:HEAT repeat protein
MALQELMERLAGKDSQTRRAALDELVQVGEEAVGPLVATLLDEGSPVDWSDAGVILRRIGWPAFQPLVDAIAAAPTAETRRRCAWAFMGFGADLVDLYAQALSHPSPHVREQAALGRQQLVLKRSLALFSVL